MVKHWTAARRVLRYLRGTMDMCISYTKTDKLQLECFSDADWAGDVVNRRSTSGCIIKLAGGPIIYKSKQQPVVALSSCESEYIASGLAVREIV